MGSCLSKTGKKGKGGEDPDRMPYTKAKKGAGDKKNKKGKSDDVIERSDPPQDQQETEMAQDDSTEQPQSEDEASEKKTEKGDELEAMVQVKTEEQTKKVSTAASDDKNGNEEAGRGEDIKGDDLTGTQTTVFKQTVEHDPARSTATVVKESDIKVEVASEDQKTVQIKRETKTISKVNYPTPDVAPLTSSSVVKDVRPVSISSEEGKTTQKASNTQHGEKSPEPMALFGALRYLKENEEKDVSQDKESDAVNDIFSNMYKPYDVTSPPPFTPPPISPPTQKDTSPDVKISTSTRPISDVFSKLTTTPENVTTTRTPENVTTTSTITTEKYEKGDAQIVRTQQVTVTSKTEPAFPTKEAEDLPPPLPTSPPPAQILTQEPGITLNGPEAEQRRVNGVSPIRSVSPETEHLEKQVEPQDQDPVTEEDEADEGGIEPSIPLTPLRITEVGDIQSPLASHINANVIITTPEPPSVPKIEITPESPEPKDTEMPEYLPDNDKDGISEDDEETEDVNGQGAESEPVVRKKLRSMVKELLEDFSANNETIMNRHQLCANTRQRILSWIDKWVSKQEGPTHRVVMVTGPLGIGKTCLASEVVKRHGPMIAGSHFFEYNHHNLNHNRLRSVIKSIAHNFCDVFPNYIHVLPSVEKLKHVISHGTVQEVFDTLIHGPLNSAELENDPEKPMLIVLDSIDECDPLEKELLIEVVSSMTESCPEWLRILLTARSDSKLQQGQHGIHTLEMKQNSNENSTDIKRFFREPLGRFMDRISLDGGLTQLAKKTEGSFLCAILIKKRLDALPPDRKIALREIVPMFPSTLSGICKELFSNFLESLSTVVHDGNEKRAYSTILSNMAVAREPLPVTFILDVVDTTTKDPRPILADIEDVLLFENNCVSFCHLEICEWLLDNTRSGTCTIDNVQGREQIASLCLRWLDDIMNEGQGEVQHTPLLDYALKHTVYHLLDVSKQQENLSRLLCNMRYIQSKLGVPNVNVTHVHGDYQHQHLQINQSGAIKLITLFEYMKRYPKMIDQMNSYRRFLDEKRYEIQQCPDHVLQVAANFSTIERIQHNARLELENKEWIEDVTAIPETHCIATKLNGIIRAIDVAPDGKTIAAVSKDDEYNVWLHLINSMTGEEKIKPVDIKTLNDRVGLLAKFFPDANHVFVGSLTTLLSTRGKASPSGFDVNGIDVKDKFSIECADVSVKHFACGLTTFPWGGKSLHLCIFDMRTKKCLKTIEVLRFRYGGSAQFSIKACAVAKDKSFVCACVKQSPKPQLRIIVWNVSKFQVVNSIDVNNEEITKCLFVGDQTVLLGGGIRSSQAMKSSTQHVPVVSEYWNYKEVTNKVSNRWDESEQWSLFSGHEDAVACCRWYSNMDNALVHVWSHTNITRPAAETFRIRGLRETSEMLSGGNCFLFLSHDEIYIYNIDDLEALPQDQEADSLVSLPELVVHSVSFIPRLESIVVVSQDRQQDSNKDPTFSVYMCALHQDEMSLVQTPFRNIPRANLASIEMKGQFKSFYGTGASTAMCFSSADGNFFVFNADDHIKVWDRVNDRVSSLPTYQDLKNSYAQSDDFSAVKAYASPKDNTLAVVYGQIPYNIFLYDMRHGSQLRVLKQEEAANNAVTDVIFMPSNGLLFAYHRSMDHQLVTWNPRTGDQVVTTTTVVSYARASPESDRLAISSRNIKRKEGHVLLRNSDNKVSRKVLVPDRWLPSNTESDLEFSGDGTTLVGVCYSTGVCRIWNAANGEVLNDLLLKFTCPTDIVGLLTNTHVVFQDDRLIIVDIATGNVSSVLSLEERMDRKCNMAGMLVSLRGGMLVGRRASSHLKIFRCHNFHTIKRKTTLQRMISFKK